MRIFVALLVRVINQACKFNLLPLVCLNLVCQFECSEYPVSFNMEIINPVWLDGSVDLKRETLLDVTLVILVDSLDPDLI